MAEVSVRPATANDAPAIAELHVASWNAAHGDLVDHEALARRTVARRERTWTAAIEAGMTIFAAAAGGTPIGFAAIEGDELSCVYVAPSRWGEGAGSALLDAAHAQMHGRAVLHVIAGNTAARRFYERHGWTLVAGSERRDAELRAPVVTYARESGPSGPRT